MGEKPWKPVKNTNFCFCGSHFSVWHPNVLYWCAFDRRDLCASLDVLMSFLRRLENFLQCRKVETFSFSRVIYGAKSPHVGYTRRVKGMKTSEKLQLLLLRLAFQRFVSKRSLSMCIRQTRPRRIFWLTYELPATSRKLFTAPRSWDVFIFKRHFWGKITTCRLYT